MTMIQVRIGPVVWSGWGVSTYSRPVQLCRIAYTGTGVACLLLRVCCRHFGTLWLHWYAILRVRAVWASMATNASCNSFRGKHLHESWTTCARPCALQCCLHRDSFAWSESLC